MMRARFVALAVGIAAVAVSGALLLPRASCCETAEPLSDKLNAEAANGNLAAISALYVQAKSDGVRPMEEHWALEGALRGDGALRSAFAGYFKSMDPARQQRVLGQIREKLTMAGAPCLLQSLGDASIAGVACD